MTRKPRKQRCIYHVAHGGPHAYALVHELDSSRCGRLKPSKRRRLNPVVRVRNPRRLPGRVIYGRLLQIEAQKTQPHRCDAGCKKAMHRYYHPFKSGAVVYGLSNGDLLISSKK